jgi:hypothetical protein
VLRRRRRLYDVAADAVGTLVGDPERDRAARSAGAGLGVRRRLTELAGDVGDDGGAAYVARVIGGNLRLLVGMVGANHPWRLVGRLWRAMLAAVAAVAFGLIQVEVWRIAATLGPLRLAIAGLASIAAASVTLIAGHGLWERAPAPRVREQVTLFNLATTATVDYVRLAWLASTLGTIGGALGATLETDEAVREAAYAHRPANDRVR